MDKRKIIEAVRERLTKDLQVLKEAALIAHEAATNEESQPENEYDTRALEASYIAGAQAKRAAELEELLAKYKYLEIRDFSPEDPIASTALVELEHLGKNILVFVMSNGGGMTLQVDGRNIQVVTPSSPLGESLLGLREGDVALVEMGDKVKEYDILSVR